MNKETIDRIWNEEVGRLTPWANLLILGGYLGIK